MQREQEFLEEDLYGLGAVDENEEDKARKKKRVKKRRKERRKQKENYGEGDGEGNDSGSESSGSSRSSGSSHSSSSRYVAVQGSKRRCALRSRAKPDELQILHTG